MQVPFLQTYPQSGTSIFFIKMYGISWYRLKMRGVVPGISDSSLEERCLLFFVFKGNQIQSWIFFVRDRESDIFFFYFFRPSFYPESDRSNFFVRIFFFNGQIRFFPLMNRSDFFPFSPFFLSDGFRFFFSPGFFWIGQIWFFRPVFRFLALFYRTSLFFFLFFVQFFLRTDLVFWSGFFLRTMEAPLIFFKQQRQRIVVFILIVFFYHTPFFRIIFYQWWSQKIF